MCNAKSLLTVGALAAAAYTGGASLGLLGGEAAAAGAASAATSAGVAGAGSASAAAAAATAASGTTAATAGLGLQVAGTALAAGSAYANADMQQKMAQRNAAVAGMQADDATRRGDLAAIEAQRRGNALAGAQRAGLSARGLDLSEGTPADIMGQTDFFTQSDVATARTNGRREAWSARAQQGNYRMQADAANPGLAMAGTLLGGGGKVADKWYASFKG